MIQTKTRAVQGRNDLGLWTGRGRGMAGRGQVEHGGGVIGETLVGGRRMGMSIIISSSSRSSIGVILLRAKMDMMNIITMNMTAVALIGEMEIKMAVNTTVTIVAMLIIGVVTATIVRILLLETTITAMRTAAGLTVKIPALKPTFDQKL
ncbi:hypothetical protein DFP73DRAFT_537780 [Morchella snyderi]|nr:hypothetical protein DFP73DRAFT_537780 [Morchella snyderi]